MSISIFGLGTAGITDRIKYYVREHASEIAIMGIVVAISVGIGVLATGDINQALEAGNRRGRR